MSSQADDYRHCVAIYYPGFSSLHPSHLPLQNNKPISLSNGIGATLSSYEELLLRYGIRSHLPKYLKNPRMRDFVKDAFWWIFLEHFVSVDLELLLQQVKGNTLVSDDDMKAFQFDTVVPTHIHTAADGGEGAVGMEYELAGVQEGLIPTLPILRAGASIGAPTRHRLRDVAKSLPAHVDRRGHVGNRKVEDVALVGSPRCSSALSIAEAVESRPQSAARRHRHTQADVLEGQVTGMMSPRAPGEWDDMGEDDEDISDTSSTSSVASAMRVTVFSNSRVQLHKLPLDVRLQIAAKEQHQLFTRMAMNYGSLCTQIMGMNVGLKDAITRLLPEVLAQLLFYLFTRAIPYATKLLDIPFQISLGQKLSFWIGGVERIYNVRTWGIHAFLDPVKRLRKQSRAHSIRAGNNKQRDRGSVKDIDRQRSQATGYGSGSYAPAPPTSGAGRAGSSAPPRILSFTVGGISEIPLRASDPPPVAVPVRAVTERSPTSAESSKKSSDAPPRPGPSSTPSSKKPSDAPPRPGPSSTPSSKKPSDAPPQPGPSSTPSSKKPSDAPPRQALSASSQVSSPRQSDVPPRPNDVPKKSSDSPPRPGVSSRGPSPRQSDAPSPRRSDAPPRQSDAPSPRRSDAPPRQSDAPSPRRSDWSSAGRRPDAPPPLFMVGASEGEAGGTMNASPLRSMKSMRRLPTGVLRNPRGGMAASPQVSEEEAARQRRKEQLLKQDLDTMKDELNRFKVTHTFAQFHYSGHVTRQVPTFRDADVDVDPSSGKIVGVEERLPARIAQAFAIGPKKRNVQVIKKDLESKFLSNPPWYAGKNQRISIKDQNATATKFALNNWSPLLHRFMLANGEENLRPAEAMNWTI